MSRKQLFILVFLLAVFSLFSQEEQWWAEKPIEDIRFTNLKYINENELAPIVREYIGKEFTDQLSWEIQSRIFALDFFESYNIEAHEGRNGQESVIIIFNVKERPVIGKITFIGNRALRNRELLDVILLKTGDMVNRNKVRFDVDAIKQLYLEKGFPGIDVDGRIEEPVDGEAALVFTIEEGNQNRVREVLFSGNEFGSHSTLKRLVDTKAQSLFNSGIFQASVLETDKQKILDYYWQRGFIDARIDDVTITEAENDDENRNYLTITFFIIEGGQWTYGGMEFEGNTLYKDDELSRLVRQKVGSTINKTTLELDFTRVADVYFNDGYIYNSINKEEIRNNAERTVSYKVTFVERGRAHIENIILKGNTKTKDYVIYRELPFEVGDVFSKDRFVEGLGNLYNLQYFSNIYPETPVGSSDGLMDLVLNVEEGKTIDLQFGVSFAGGIEGFPIIGFINLADKNFRGRGQEIGVSAEASSTSQQITLSFKENWLFDKRISAGASLAFEHSTTKNTPQDILPPYGIRDPYSGVIVDRDGNPVQELPPGATIGGKDDDYTYDYLRFEDYTNEYDMNYDSYDITLGVNAGYVHHAAAYGRFGISGGISLTLSHIDYDTEIYRPYDTTIRDNLGVWLPVPKEWITLYWDSRVIVNNPVNGHLVSQGFTFAGGLNPDWFARHYIKSVTKAEKFFTLWDTYLFNDWPFKGVLALHTAASFVFPQLNGEFNPLRSELLYIDGMMTGRGWGFGSGRTDYWDGQSMWDSYIELRVPLAQQIIWLDTFASMVLMNKRVENDNSAGIEAFFNPDWEDAKYTIGTGFRFVIPGLPLGFYFTKRFKITGGEIAWEPGNTGAFFDFVLAFTQTF